MIKSLLYYARRVLITLLLLSGLNSLKAQSFFSINWEKEYDVTLAAKANSLIRLTDGNFILAGETTISGTTGSRILVLKIDAAGAIVWQKIFGSNGDFRLKSTLSSKAEGFYILGTKQTGSTAPVIWITKVDNTGNQVWESTTGGSENESMTDLAETSDNGILLCGYKEIKGDHDTDAWLIKFNKKGMLESQALFGSRYINDEFSAIESDNINGYIVAGYTSSKIGGGKVPYLVKVDYRGTKLWEKQFLSLPASIPGAIAVRNDGSFYCMAKTFSSSGDFEKLTRLSVDANGNLTDQYSTERNLMINKNTFITDKNGQLIMISEPGENSNEPGGRYFIKLDDHFLPVWIRLFESADVSYSMLNQVSENNFLSAGLVNAGNNKLSLKAMAFQDYSQKLIDNYTTQKFTSSGGMKPGESNADFRNRIGQSVYEGLLAGFTNDAKRELNLLPSTSASATELRNTQPSGEIVQKVSQQAAPASGQTLPLNGKYYALLIAVNEYNDANINNLDKPVSDAQKLFDVLVNEYLFEKINVTFLKNPTREQIISSLDKYEKELTSNDNFLLFYAGHGYWNETTQKGYWLPSDAKKQNTSNWIGNSTISDYIKSIKAKHTLLISDACFGGSIFKTRAAFTNQELSTIRLYELQSRKAMTSGNLTEVPDKSVFIEFLVKRLQENQDTYLSSEQLFFSFKPSVMNNTESVPEYGVVFNTGDDGGDFIFAEEERLILSFIDRVGGFCYYQPVVTIALITVVDKKKIIIFGLIMTSLKQGWFTTCFSRLQINIFIIIPALL